MSAAVQQPSVLLDNRRTFASMMSAFSPFSMGMQQPYVVTASTTPLLIQGLTPNGIAPQPHPASLAIFHPTPAISLASTPATSASSSPTAAAVSAISVPPSSLSALRTRRESRPAAQLRGSAELMCDNKQCGMRFASEESLIEHLTRRAHQQQRHQGSRRQSLSYSQQCKSHTHASGSLTAQCSSQAGRGTKAKTPTARSKPGVENGEKAKGGKRPHAATNGEKAGRQKLVNGGKKQQKAELNDDHDEDISDDEGSSLSSDSDSDLSSDTDGSLDTDDSISDSDDDGSDSSDGDDDDKGGPFERFGRAIPSSSSSSSSDSNAASDDSSPRRTRRSSSSRRRPPTTTRPPRSSRSSPSSATDPPSSSPAAHPTSSRDPRVERIHRLHYLYKYRQPLTTPVHSLRCVLCNSGMHPNLGLLLSCHGGCGLSFHQHCMEMWTVPSGPWYCSDQCVKDECRVKEDASEDGRLDVDLAYLQLCRRWQQWYYKKEETTHRQQTATTRAQTALHRTSHVHRATVP